MTQGWIKVHRKLLDSPIFNDPYYLKLWIYCLLKATHKDREVIIGNQLIKLKPGEFVTGRKTLTEDLNSGVKPKLKLNESTWWRYLNNLEKFGMLNIKKTNKYSVVSIVNWCEYQENEHQVNIKRTSDEQQMNTNKNVKNVKNDKKYYTSKIKDLLTSFSANIPGFVALNKKYWDVIKETRATGKVAESVIYNTMKKWEKYDPVVIQYALTTHIQNHAGKREEYTIGIMRRTNEHEARRGLIKLTNKGGANFASNQSCFEEPQYDYGF